MRNRTETTDRDALTAAEMGPFTGGPYARILTALGLTPPAHVVRAILAVIALTWLPLVVLAAVQGVAYSGEPKSSLLLDAAIYARYLIATPLLVIAESYCLPVMARILRHFDERGLIADVDRERYDNLLDSTRQALNNPVAGIIIAGLVATEALLLVRVAPSLAADSWRFMGGHLTYAGWWQALVSRPIYQFALYVWLWRLFLWGRCLFTLSRFSLRLQPGHPDKVGGLGFVNVVLSVLTLLAFALACVPAGVIADRALFAGKDVTDFKPEIIAFVVLVVAILAGPLLFFTPALRRARLTGIFRYGRLASVAMRRERAGKSSETTEEEAEDGAEADFSTTAERFANAQDIKLTLMDNKSLAAVVAAILLPFLPVVMIQVPLADILEKLKGLIL